MSLKQYWKCLTELEAVIFCGRRAMSKTQEKGKKYALVTSHLLNS